MRQDKLSIITQLKLNELRRQRARLLDEYAALSARLNTAVDNATKLTVLYKDLQNITFANHRLHPDVANLEMITDDGSLASPSLINQWFEHLQHELDLGRRRTEFVYIFGALLEQWVNNREGESDHHNREEIRAELLSLYRSPPESVDISPLLDEALALYEPMRVQVERKGTSYTPGDDLRTNQSEVTGALHTIRDDIYRPQDLRQDAAAFAENDLWAKELSDAMNIVFSDFEDWDWPLEGVQAHLSWTHNKWRLFLGEDLLTAVFLELAGYRAESHFDVSLAEARVMNRAARLSQLRRLKAPAVILSNEHRMLKEAMQKTPARYLSGWDMDTVQIHLPDDADGLASLIDDNSIVAMRAIASYNARRALRSAFGYTAIDYDSNVSRIVALVNAEIKIARAAFPNQPFYVIKLDLKDFYPTVPHHVLLEMLKRLGIDTTFFDRYLHTRLRDGDEVFRAERGMPNGHRLSHLLGDILLNLLDMTVQQRAVVQVVRVVDDITLLAASAEEAMKAWQAVQDFCVAAGLVINREKTGTVVVGGSQPDALPEGAARWSLLRLDPDGEWRVDETMFTEYLERTRANVHAADAILHKARIYNDSLRYLLHAIGLSAQLGDTHQMSVSETVAHFHHRFYADGRSIVTGLQKEIQVLLNTDIPIPESWFYWPLTAGGLGLYQPLIEVSGRRDKATKLQAAPEIPEVRTSHWQFKENDWYKLYRWYITEIDATEPLQNSVMETLVDDFIQRGSVISAGKQKGLSTYWRWIVYLYGPDMLEYFGTFRFLMTELVPLQLILDQRAGGVVGQQ